MSNPVALITGATRGIGRAIALDFAKSGYDIAFCYRRHSSLVDELISDLKKIGSDTVHQSCDIRLQDQVEAFFSEVDSHFGRLDVLVNNAGVTHDGLLVTTDLSDINEVLQTNIIGTLLCCQNALALMMPARSGVIINISSISATQPNRGQCHYAASKGAVESLTRALAVEVASRGIRVNAVAPGVIQTDMANHLIESHESEIKKRLLSKSLGRPEDVAAAVLFLAKPENHFITGIVLPVNGGMTLT